MRKKVTTELIEKYLDQYGWKRHQAIDEPGEREGIVLTGWTSPLSPDGHILAIDPIVEKHGLVFTVREIAKAPTDTTPSDRLSGLLLAMATINFRLVMGAFSYDPSDGELVFKLGIPVASDDLHYEDFEHCLNGIAVTIDVHAANLRGIIEGTKTAQDVIH